MFWKALSLPIVTKQALGNLIQSYIIKDLWDTLPEYDYPTWTLFYKNDSFPLPFIDLIIFFFFYFYELRLMSMCCEHAVTVCENRMKMSMI